LGFVGALLFLAPAFALARRTSSGPPGYVLLGGLAGAAHAAAGFVFAWVARGWEDVIPWPAIRLLGGFAFSFASSLPLTTICAATVAGAVSGFLYGRLIRL